MTFNEFIGVRNANIDIETGEQLSHQYIYRRAIMRFGGLKAIEPFIPFSLEEIKKALAKGDEHLNTLNMKRWDNASGFYCQGSECCIAPSPIWNLYRQHHVTSASCSQSVCLLKEAARWLAERSKAK